MPLGVDHVADASGSELCRLAKLYEFPAFVKQADMEQVFRPGQLAVTVYADPVRRQFPCHNAASAWLSNLYFTEKRAEFHAKDQTRIQERLDHYTRYWRIEPAVARLHQQHAAYHKAAEARLPDSAYAYVRADGATGHKERHLRLLNAQEVKAAADYLFTYRDRFSFRDRHQMARRILEKAARFGASVGGRRDFLERQAGLGVCDPDAVIDLLRKRACLADLPALKEQILKLAAVVEHDTRAALQPDNLIQLAETVDVIDRGLGLPGKYSEGLPRPEDVLFAATFSKASEELHEHVATTGGMVYKKADLGRIRLDELRALFGRDFAEEVRSGLDGIDAEKLAEQVGALPRGDSELFDQLAAEAGVKPVLRKAASVRQGFSRDDWQKMAAAYLPAGNGQGA